MNSDALEQTRQAWDRLADGFDEFITPAGNMDLGEEALRRVGLGRGMRFLDVAAGSGALSIPAARLGAQVLGVDISPRMIERLEARARAEGLDLAGRVMDGHALAIEDGAFDVAGSQFGVMLFPDLARGTREMVRVTRPGGRVFIVAFGPPPQVEFLGFFLEALQASVPGFKGPPMNPPPLPFQVADPEVLRQKMAAAGLKEVRVEPATWRLTFHSGTHMWNCVTHSNPIGAMLVADLTADEREQAQKKLDHMLRMLRERSGGGGPAVLENRVHIGIGTK